MCNIIDRSIHSFLLFFCSSKKEPKPAKAVKRKAPTSKKSAVTKSTGWQIDSDSEEEAVVRRRGSETQPLQSSLSRRVADGVLRRTTQRDGDVYIEIKVYNTKEILKVEPKDRWEQAVISLKYQADSDAPELIPLKEALKLCKKKFTEEGKFFTIKKK